MKHALAVVVLLAAACGGKDPETAKPKAVERAQSGWMWTRAETVLRAKPTGAAAEIATIPAESRVGFTKVIDAGGRTTWYWLVPPGGAAGWAPATGLSATRLTPAPRAIAATPVAGAATGVKLLDARALTNAEGQPVRTGDAATDLATLQNVVDGMYGGVAAKADKRQAARAADAAAFRKGIP